MSITFDEWWRGYSGENRLPENTFIKLAYEAGTQSRQEEVLKLQDEVAELNRKIAMYEKHVNAIKVIHENQFDENSDTSWILGNLDGFFECLESDLKGKENEH